MTKPSILRIEGVRAHRYVNGKHVEIAELDSELTGPALRQAIEDFRANGLPEVPPAPAAPAKDPCEAVFERIASQLEKAPPAMTPRVSEAA